MIMCIGIEFLNQCENAVLCENGIGCNLKCECDFQRPKNTSSNSDYMKCLDDIWDIVSVNLRSGKWDKSEFGEILKKHFAYSQNVKQ